MQSTSPAKQRRLSVVFMAPFGSLNGANRSMLLLAEYLKPLAKVSVVALEHDEDVVEHARQRGVRFITAVQGGERLSRAGRLRRAFSVLRREVRAQGAQVLVANTARGLRFAWPVARLEGISLVCHQRDSYLKDYYHLGIGFADRIVVPSRFVVATLPQRLQGRTRVHYNPVETPPESALGFKGSPGWTKRWQTGPIRIGVAGLVYPKKGQDLLLRAAPRVLASYKAAEFHLWGASPERSVTPYLAKLRRLAEPLGASVKLHAFATDVAPFFEQMDVVVQPSRFDEAFGRVAAEALAYAAPVVVANRGALPEVVIPGTTGYAHAPDDPEALADCLLELLGHPAEAEARGRAGRLDVVTRFDPVRHAEAMHDEFQALVGRGGN